MLVQPYLAYNGNCAAAFKFYEKVLGAKIEMMMTFDSAPPGGMQLPDEWNKKIMHASMNIDGEVVMGADAPPGHFKQPQGFSISLQVPDPAEAERRFKALSEGGSIIMAFAPTFFSNGFGMCFDQFGIPWMVNSPKEM